MESDEIKSKLKEALLTIDSFEWLLNSYVLDFYVEDHWNKMPNSWAQTFENIHPENVADLLAAEQCSGPSLWPLSLLALQVLLRRLCISREPTQFECNHNVLDVNNNLSNKLQTILTKKNIKAKKRHEIEKMSQLTTRIAGDCDVQYIVDFGAGLGHLARTLAFNYGAKVCCLEQQLVLTEQAMLLDEQFERQLRKNGGIFFERPRYLTICLKTDTDLKELVQKIKKCFDVNEAHDFRFGIIGLHPCGDLASILTNFFLQCPEAAFLNLVGCCYMKLTCAKQNDLYERKKADDDLIGYPLSAYLRDESSFETHLSYETREIACHAIEKYAKKLSSGNYDSLRVHSYRAAIEKIICGNWPLLKHAGLRSIKSLTTFSDYCQRAVSHMDIKIPYDEVESDEVTTNLAKWKNVVIFYSLRLMLAPLIESVILYDRILCLMEKECDTAIRAIFDPLISSRNHIITAVKKKNHLHSNWK